MSPASFGDILEAIVGALPADAPALIHGDRVILQRDFWRRTNNLAHALIARGAQPGDKVAFYMHNHPAYCELLAACWKARLVHVNVNYRYTPEEVHYIFDNSDAKFVVFGAELGRSIEAIRPRLDKVQAFVEVDSGGDAAEDFETLAETGDGQPLHLERSGDDMLFLYTGGTTGMPKGVMWRQEDLAQLFLRGLRPLGPPFGSLDEVVETVRTAGPARPAVIGPPLMHGTGLFTAIGAMFTGGPVITLTKRHFDPLEMIEATDRWRAGAWTIVGDPFGRPLVETLDADPGRFDVSCVQRVTSSGVMWSVEVKRALLRHMPEAVLMDGFSSSEALGMGTSTMTAGGEVQTAKFMLGERTRVFDEDGRPVAPGSGVRGLVAVGPPNPIGYYKDPDKTDRTFKLIDGVRYSIPGDWCLVEADGTLTLLGRGNACINTAGEKVFPEEVEERLKTHPDVEDALVVGLPDPKWGQSVTAVVRLRPGRTLNEAALISHVREHLAPYKAPKRVVTGDLALRAPNGKADYKSATAFAASALQAN